MENFIYTEMRCNVVSTKTIILYKNLYARLDLAEENSGSAVLNYCTLYNHAAREENGIKKKWLRQKCLEK
jgi:hypothetical protein